MPCNINVNHLSCVNKILITESCTFYYYFVTMLYKLICKVFPPKIIEEYRRIYKNIEEYKSSQFPKSPKCVFLVLSKSSKCGFLVLFFGDQFWYTIDICNWEMVGIFSSWLFNYCSDQI